MSSQARHFENKLKPVNIDDEGLMQTLKELQTCIADAIGLIVHLVEDRSLSDGRDSIYTGNAGIALMLLRLAARFEDAGLDTCPGFSRDFPSSVPSLIGSLLPHLRPHRTKGGHVSPLDSPAGSALIYVLSSLTFPSSPIFKESATANSEEGLEWQAAIKTLKYAVDASIDSEDSYGEMDELLYGRAGLLWAILNLQAWLREGVTENKDSRPLLTESRKQELHSIAGDNVVEDMITEIVESGDAGAQASKAERAEYGLPMIWNWHGKLYLGAIHGVAGILTILFQSPRPSIDTHLEHLLLIVDSLCRLTVQNDGHLPSSLPVHSSSHPYVQICHGSPGLLVLLSIIRIRFPHKWNNEWEDAERMASDAIWREGLVTKGLGVCHGVSGNAWPWLLQARARQGTKEGDEALSRALAFLRHARNLPPMPSPDRRTSQYRTPDHPYSLFEGLAGTVCAWLDACVLIRGRISSSDRKVAPILGLPGLGGNRVHGLL